MVLTKNIYFNILQSFISSE